MTEDQLRHIQTDLIGLHRRLKALWQKAWSKEVGRRSDGAGGYPGSGAGSQGGAGSSPGGREARRRAVAVAARCRRDHPERLRQAAGSSGGDAGMSASLNPSEKRTIARSQQGKAGLFPCRGRCGTSGRSDRPAAPTNSAESEETREATILAVLAALQKRRHENQQKATAAVRRRQELARRPLVSLAEWRAFVLPPPTHVRGKPVPPPPDAPPRCG